MQKILLPPVLVVTVTFLMWGLSAVAPLGVAITGWGRLLGVVLAAAALGLALAGSRLFARVDTNISTFHDPGKLVTTGPFRFTRNPMYLGFTGFLVGMAIAVGSASAWVGPVVFLAAADRWYIPFEERRMATSFGAAYDEYRTSTPRWLGARR